LFANHREKPLRDPVTAEGPDSGQGIGDLRVGEAVDDLGCVGDEVDTLDGS
jgi:hypothetical protein